MWKLLANIKIQIKKEWDQFRLAAEVRVKVREEQLVQDASEAREEASEARELAVQKREKAVQKREQALAALLAKGTHDSDGL